jgi:ABC-type glycerol-3-phosphate transport system substrate-binding protein
MSRTQLYPRRRFIQDAAGVAAMLTGVEVLAGCGGLSAGSDASNGELSATVSDMPPDSNKTGLQQFKDTVALFEKQHPKQHIVGHTYKFDPTTYYARLAAGQAEDALLTYFTEPQYMIAHHYASDITNLMKSWQYFSSIDPNILQIVTGPDQHIYGVPVSGYALCILYNRSLFKQAGLDPDKPPTTWEEFRGYAKQIAGKGVAGFAETSTKNGGGWLFANWMYTAGGELEVKDGDRWKVVYNSDKGVAVLNLLKAMRFTDKSMTQEQLLDADTILPLIANKKVAMIVTSPSRLADLKVQYQANLDDFGLAPMPQNGGNAAMSGGSIWVFNPKSKPDVVKLAYDWTIFSRFDLNVLDAKYAAQAKSNQPVGLPTNIIFKGAFQEQLDSLIKKYANVPLQNYQPFVKSTLQLKAEPPKETQKMYASLDPVVQAILTTFNADPKKLLDQAAQQFQAQVLDKVKA